MRVVQRGEEERGRGEGGSGDLAHRGRRVGPEKRAHHSHRVTKVMCICVLLCMYVWTSGLQKLSPVQLYVVNYTHLYHDVSLLPRPRRPAQLFSS